MKKIAATVFAAAAAGALVAGPAVGVPGPNYNSASYWSTELGMDCMKLSVSGVPYWTADAAYGAVIIKGGSVNYGDGPGNVVYRDVEAGDMLYAPLNAGGQQAAVSHVIVCDPGSSDPS